MAKFYGLRSKEGEHLLAIPKAAARDLVKRGKASYVPNVSAVQMIDSEAENSPAERQKSEKAPKFNLTRKDFGGFSASPSPNLMHRYVAAKGKDCRDPLAAEVIVAFDGLPAGKDLRLIEGWSHPRVEGYSH